MSSYIKDSQSMTESIANIEDKLTSSNKLNYLNKLNNSDTPSARSIQIICTKQKYTNSMYQAGIYN